MGTHLVLYLGHKRQSCSSFLLETELPSADLWNAKNSQTLAPGDCVVSLLPNGNLLKFLREEYVPELRNICVEVTDV